MLLEGNVLLRFLVFISAFLVVAGHIGGAWSRCRHKHVALSRHPRMSNMKCGDNLKCLNGGRCTNGRCLCAIGYTGTGCEKRVDIMVPQFSGQSYLELDHPATQLSGRFKMEIVFNARELTGLLVYVGKRGGDFLTVFLFQGKVIYRFDCGSGAAEIQSKVNINVNENATLVFGLEVNSGYLLVNGETAEIQTCQGNSSRVDLKTNLYLGGYRGGKISRYHTPVSFGFVGCFLSVRLNNRNLDLFYKPGLPNVIGGFDIGDCSKRICQRVDCGMGTCVPKSSVSYRCACSLGSSGHHCSRDENIKDLDYIPKFREGSYLLYRDFPEAIDAVTEISLLIKFTSGHGLLLYTADDDSKDFLSVNLHNEYVWLSVDLGSGVKLLRSASQLSFSNWSRIHVKREGRQLSLTVGDQNTVTSTTGSGYTQLNTNNHIYIGGHADLDEVVTRDIYATPFTGCIAQVIINGVQLLTKDAVAGREVESCEHICQKKNICDPNSRCVPDGDEFRCACPLGQTGAKCDKEVGKVTVPMFKGTSFLFYDGQRITNSGEGTSWDIRVTVRAKCTQCLLLWVGQNSSMTKGDYLLVALNHHGYLFVEFDLGGGPVSLTYLHQPVNGSEYHKIQIFRRDSYASLATGENNIDRFPQPPGPYNQLNTDSGLYLGGYPPGKASAKYSPFTGCIKQVKVNLKPIDLMEEATAAENVEQCSLS